MRKEFFLIGFILSVALCREIFAGSSYEWANFARSIDTIEKIGENETLEEENQTSDYYYEEAGTYEEDVDKHGINSSDP